MTRRMLTIAVNVDTASLTDDGWNALSDHVADASDDIVDAVWDRLVVHFQRHGQRLPVELQDAITVREVQV